MSQNITAQKEIEAIYPLSHAQRGMLYETILAREPGIHIEQFVYLLKGPLDVATFQHAWDQVAKRHAVLRTAFVWESQTEPLQVVRRTVAIPLEQHDWRAISPLEQEKRLEEYLFADRQRGFKLTRAPLLRLALLQKGDDAYYFIWTLHHILMDGWCGPLVLDEVISCYRCSLAGRPFTPRPAQPYRDYIGWLRNQDLSKAEKFWRRTLHGFTYPTPPGKEEEMEAPEFQGEGYGSQRIILEERITAALLRRAREFGLTLNTLIQGAWALLLSRYNERDDVLFGVTVSGRSPQFPGIETLIGPCINTLPVRIKVPEEDALFSWLSAIQALNSELREYEYSPGEQVRRWCDLPGAFSLYESLLVFENYPQQSPPVPSWAQGFTLERLYTRGAQTKYALTLLTTPGRELEIECVYHVSRLQADDAALILEHLSLLLKKMPTDMNAPLGHLLECICGNIPRIRSLRKHSQRAPSTNLSIAPRTRTERTLASIYARCFGIEQVSITDNFLALGGDSLIAALVIAQAREAGLNLRISQILQYQTIAELAEVASAYAPIHAEQGLVLGALPLTPNQHMFFETYQRERHHWNIATLLEVPPHFDPRLLAETVKILLEHHDGLRLRSQQEADGTWRQFLAEPSEAHAFSLIDISGEPEEQRKATIEAQARDIQKSLNLTTGPLFRVAYFTAGNNESGRLLIVVHHTVCAGFSWQILLEDFFSVYQQLRAGGEPHLPHKTTSLRYYATRLTEYARRSTLRQEVAYWLTGDWQQVPPLPVDFPNGHAFRDSARDVSLALGFQETKTLLQELPEAYGVHIMDILLSALIWALAQWSGLSSFLIDLEYSGQDTPFPDIDLARTVGWFNYLCPVLLRLERRGRLEEALQEIKQQLNSVPNKGLSYGIARYLSEDQEVVAQLRALPRPQILFNYEGQLEQRAIPEAFRFPVARENPGPLASQDGIRRHLFQFHVQVVDGRLALRLTYSAQVHRRETTEQLLDHYREIMQALVGHYLLQSGR
jgi:non-ribosomal peptide synthase protein (TIGR01720 family)